MQHDLLRRCLLRHLLCWMDSDWIRAPYAEEQHDVEGANPQPQPDAAVIEPTQEAAAAEAASKQLDAPLTASPEAAAPPAAEAVDDEWAEQTGRRPISAFEKVAVSTLVPARVQTTSTVYVTNMQGTMFYSMQLRPNSSIQSIGLDNWVLLRLCFRCAS